MGTGFTLTITASLAEPQLKVLVTVYDVVTVGFATGLTHVVQLNPSDGNHKYIPPPLALRVVFPPIHIVASAPAFTEGVVLIVTFTKSAILPQEFVTVNV